MPNPSVFTSVINAYLPEPQASLLNGIIFGVDIRAGKNFYQQLKIVGLLHLVVLSGMNISLLSSIIANFTGFFSKRLSIMIVILMIVVFIIFVGSEAPIIRAGFMGIVTFVGIINKRKAYPLFILFLSFLFILIFWPQWLKTLSLQLSYGATIGLIFFGRVAPPRSSEKQNEIEVVFDGLKFFIWKQLKPSLAAQIFTAPLIFVYFRQISLIAPLANVLAAPVIPSLMIFGFLTAILGKINYFLGLPFAYLCYGLLSYIVLVIDRLSAVPFVFISFSK